MVESGYVRDMVISGEVVPTEVIIWAMEHRSLP
jgi:hypothetical protein